MQTSELRAVKTILSSVPTTTLWGLGIAQAIQVEAKIPRLLNELESQYKDNPEVMEGIVGKENCKLLFKTAAI